MKKLILLPLLLLCSCVNKGNQDNKMFINDEHSTFYKIHIFELKKCIEIQTWHEEGYQVDSIQVLTKNNTRLQIHKNQCILINGKCPSCEVE